MKRFCLTVLILTALLTGIASAETKVNRIAIATGIENREPVNVNDTFKNDVNKLYCFSEIATDTVPTKVVHIWLYKDNIIAEIPLNVNSGKWRTYSSKNIIGTWIGDWKVEVYSEQGKLIDSIQFAINE